MPALAPRVVHLVARKPQSALHLLVRHPPVAAVDVLVRRAVLQEDADRLRLGLADQRRILVPAPQPDVSADRREDARERVRPLPRRRPRRDGAGARAADGAVASALRKVDRPPVRRRFPLHFRQEFFEQKARVIRPEAIVFQRAVEAVQCARVQGPHAARRHENTDRHRHLAARDEVIEHGRRTPLHAVLVHVDARRRGPVVLPRHINAHLARGPGEDRALLERKPDQLPARHPFLRLCIRVRRVVVRRAGGEEQTGERAEQEREDFHRQGRAPCPPSRPSSSLRTRARRGGWLYSPSPARNVRRASCHEGMPTQRWSSATSKVGRSTLFSTGS